MTFNRSPSPTNPEVRPGESQSADQWWHRRGFRIAASLSLVVLFLGLFIWYLFSHWAEFSQLRLASAAPLVTVALCFLGSVTLRGIFSLVVLRAFEVRLTFPECFKLSAATTMSNFLLPFRGGAALRAVYLRRNHDFPYTYFLSTVTALVVFFVFVHAGVGLATTAWLGLTQASFSWPLFLFLLAIFFAFGATIFLTPDLGPKKGPLPARLQRVADGWSRVARSKNLLGIALLTAVLDTLLAATGFYFALAAFSLPRSVAGSLLLTSSQSIGSLVGLTPGALGFQELAGMFFSTVMPISMVEALSVLASVRVIKTAVILIVGLPSLIALTRRTAGE